MSVVQITEENFAAEVLASDKPVLLDFYADRCGACHSVSSTVDAIAAERGDIKVGKIDVDAQTALAERYGVRSIPTFAVFKRGELTGRATGARPKAQILSLL